MVVVLEIDVVIDLVDFCVWVLCGLCVVFLVGCEFIVGKKCLMIDIW